MGTAYQVVRHLNEKHFHHALVFLTLIRRLQLMPHSGHCALSLLTCYGHGCLSDCVLGSRFWTDCEPNFLCLAIDSPTDLPQDCKIRSVRNCRNDSGPDFPIHFWPE